MEAILMSDLELLKEHDRLKADIKLLIETGKLRTVELMEQKK